MKVRHLSQLSVHHSDHLDDTYDVAEKEFPPELTTKHTHHEGQPIHWIANFGYRHKASGAAVAGRLEESYDIELDRHENPAAHLVYFDGTGVQPVEARPSDTAPGKVKATLNLGDPPIGWTGHAPSIAPDSVATPL
jgi:hypothetical protein